LTAFEIEDEDEVEEPFIPLSYGEFIPYPVTSKQDQVIRDYARREGFETLRGFHWHLKREMMNYYDILREESP